MKTCHNCKYANAVSFKDPCNTCCRTLDSNGNHISHSLWEPKDEEPDCEKCKYEDKGPEEEPCQECGIDGQNYFEPKEEKMRKDCDTCVHSDARSSDEPCRSCCSCTENIFSNWEPKEKEEKKMDNRKTKAQLMEELEQKNAEIAELKKELERSANYEQYLDAAKEMRSMVDAFMESGFTEEQAITIVTGLIGQATSQRLIR